MRKSRTGRIEPKRETGVAFQGEVGAYSESAVYSYFGQSVRIEPTRELWEVFAKVKRGDTLYGVVPAENSIEGTVNQTYDLFLETDLKVCGEIILKIVHCLIAQPKLQIHSIKTVYSHPQALAQCRRYLRKLGCNLIPTFDTAGSVRLIKEEGLDDSAAVASQRAAEIHGMSVLDKEIGDLLNNYTRFFVLSKRDSPPSGKDKTSIIFSVKSFPGSLYQVLREFASRKINLTKIESRPTKRTPWEYNFYLDFEGHRTDTVCKEALRSIKNKTLFTKILGSYPSSKPTSESNS